MKKIALLVTLMLSPLTWANPTDSSLRQLSELMPYQAIFFESVVAPLTQERAMLDYTLRSDNTITQEQYQKAMTAFDDYAKNLLKQLDTKAHKDKLTKAYIAAAKDNFSQQEVDVQLSFYGNEHGKSALQKSEKVYDDFMSLASKDSEQIIEDYQKKHAKKMQEEIKRIINKK